MSEITAVGILQDCISINNERGKTYNGNESTPERSFERIAEIVNTKASLSLKPSHIALVLAELKYVRYESAVAAGIVHSDSLVDYVNYNALWAELVAAEFVAPLPTAKEVAPMSEHDKLLHGAADAMTYLAACRNSIAEAVPNGTTEALTAYTKAIRALNEVSKDRQEALFGSPVTDLLNEEEDLDATNTVTAISD